MIKILTGKQEYDKVVIIPGEVFIDLVGFDPALNASSYFQRSSYQQVCKVMYNSRGWCSYITENANGTCIAENYRV